MQLLQDEGFAAHSDPEHPTDPANPAPFASGGIIPGDVQVYISPHESFITAADMRAMRQDCSTEWFSRALPEVVPGVQGEEVIGYAPASSFYPDRSARGRAFHLHLALDRDNRLNTEEKAEYNRTLVELEFGVGFFQRAHP